MKLIINETSLNSKSSTLRNYVILLVLCFVSNIISFEEKNLSTDSFVMDDPLVYEPVCCDMLVAKEYYAKDFRREVN